MLTLCAGPFWPHGHIVNKDGRGPLADATMYIPGRTDVRRTSLSLKRGIHHPKMYETEGKLNLALLSYIQGTS